MELPPIKHRTPSEKVLVGVDIFLQWQHGKPAELGESLSVMSREQLALQLITNRGVKVWPQGFPETFFVDHWRCRFTTDNVPLKFSEVLALQHRLIEAGFDLVKTENLYTFGGEPGYAAVHG
ncbi:MAG: hypothetical protein P8I38_13060 [Arenicella sp.]|nr:hypothetical protein [Arenicella sp.]